MKILITGGAGFIGSHLVDSLLKKSGNQILVIDNYATGRKENLPKENKNLTIVEGSIADRDLVNNTFDKFKPDLVVHAAAAYKDPENWYEDGQTNVIGTINIVKASIASKIKRIIYFQTSLCYGLKPLEQPISITHPYFSGGYSAGSSYSISKTAGELYVELSGLDFVSFRLANAYGPRNVSGPLPTFYQRLKDGKACFVMDTRRDFIYVDNVVAVVLKALKGKGKGYYHISTGKDFAIKQLFDATVKAMGIKLDAPVEVRKRNPDDVYTILLNNKKTKKDFEWEPKGTLEEGVKKAIAWYDKNQIDQTFTHLRNVTDKKK
jgi:UDP-glucose 4-epimerase